MGILFFIAILLFAAFGVSAVADILKKKRGVDLHVLKVVKKVIPIVIAVVVVVSVGFSTVYSVSENENAVVTMFGKVQRVDTAGVHVKVPFLRKINKVDITTHGASIGYDIKNSTQEMVAKENPQMITSDFNLINVDFYMEYKVNDPVSFLYNSEQPEEVLGNVAMSCIRAVISDYSVDDVMTTAKNEIQQKIRELLSAELQKRDIGIQLVNIMIQDVEPPTTDVFNAFKSVESAKQQADTTINNANRYKNEKLPEAEANADKIVQEAEATKAARIADAEGQVARFNKMYEEYTKFPLITKKRLFFETMEEILPDLKVIVTDGNTQSVLPVESFATVKNGGNANG